MVTYLLNGRSGLSTLIDDEDLERVSQFKWYPIFCKGGPYVFRQWSKKGKLHRVYLHQFLLGTKGIDHKNHNGLDNQKHNLRQCTKEQNAHNTRRSSRNTSGVKGVHWDSFNKKWMVQIRGGQGRITIGRFDNLDVAARAYESEAKKRFGEFACVG